MNLQMNRWILVFAALITLVSAADSESKYCIYVCVCVYIEESIEKNHREEDYKKEIFSLSLSLSVHAHKANVK